MKFSRSVYVGGLQSASELGVLKAHGITHIVNCMNRESLNVHPVKYLDFPIAEYLWRLSNHANELSPCRNAEAAQLLFAPAMEFIQTAAGHGGHVLIHCLAGAHRAGTTGVAFLMHMVGRKNPPLPLPLLRSENQQSKKQF